VGLWVSNLLLVVATGRDHALRWSIVGTLDSLSHEVKLSGSDPVFDVRDVVEYASDLGISNPYFLHSRHVDGKNELDALMQEDLKFVEQALLE
jgi:hypothetical protein